MSANPIGQTLIDQYRVDDFIAAGGMGAVYRVWDIKRNVPLAMKVLHADLNEDPTAAKRFQREANALKDLAHPHIVPFYGLFQASDFSFLLTAFVDGPTLKDLLVRRRNQPLSPVETLTFLKALSAALGYAHVNGFVHCDVKPGNVMLDQAGNIFLTDFGIARTTTGATTTTMGTAGTPAYMAPEQIRGETLTAATDIYALGVVIFELLTGQRPFRGDEVETEASGRSTGERIIYAHLNLPAPDPRRLNPNLPPLLSQAVLQAMEKDPQRRFANVRAFYTACAGALGINPDAVPDRFAFSMQSSAATERTLISHPPAATPSTATPQTTQTPPLPPSTTINIHRSPWLLVGGAVILLILVSLLGWGAYSLGSRLLAPEEKPPITPLATETLLEPIEPGEPSEMVRTEQPTITQQPDQPISTLPPQDELPAGELMENRIAGNQMIYIPSGEFLMGLNPDQAELLADMCPYCEKSTFDASSPQHPVQLDGYWIDRTEVSNAAYLRCMENGACTPPVMVRSATHADYLMSPEFGNYPVMNVTWEQAQRYCAWAGGRLPTEAEWEKAARGEDGRLFPWGDEVPNPELANVDKYSRDSKPVDSHPQGASPYGVLNMSGNVWEWVSDWYDAEYYTKNQDWTNPAGPDRPSGEPLRSGRGGSYIWSTAMAGAGVRDWYQPEPQEMGYGVGFRCAYNLLQAGELASQPQPEPAEEITDDPRRMPEAYNPLPKCAASHLHPGDWGFITFGGGHNDIRSTPDTHSSTNTIGEAQEGELLQIIGGPECNFGWILWEVQSAKGVRGWTPESDGNEFWIMPFPRWQACPSSRPSALIKGELASVAAFPDIANKVRQAPGTSSEQVGTVMPGEQVEILEGPECANGIVWWLISAPASRVTGWTAEGDEQSSWLLPSPKPEVGMAEIEWHQGRLVFPQDYNNSRALFTLDLTTPAEPELLAAPPSGQRFMGPVWSPDGTRIAFYNHTTKDILLMDAIQGAQQINVADGTQPTWSPDGNRILYRMGDGIFQVRDAATLEPVARMDVDPGANLPDWSPLTDWIAFAIISGDGATSLWQQALAGGNPRLLADRSYQNYAPAWSHDGQWIAYQSDEGRGRSEIWVMDRNGENPHRLTQTPGDAWSRGPTWSPDDRWIAFVSSQAGSIGSDYGEVFIIPAEGGDPIQITFTGGAVYDWRVHWGR